MRLRTRNRTSSTHFARLAERERSVHILCASRQKRTFVSFSKHFLLKENAFFNVGECIQSCSVTSLLVVHETSSRLTSPRGESINSRCDKAYSSLWTVSTHCNNGRRISKAKRSSYVSTLVSSLMRLVWFLSKHSHSRTFTPVSLFRAFLFLHALCVRIKRYVKRIPKRRHRRRSSSARDYWWVWVEVRHRR